MKKNDDGMKIVHIIGAIIFVVFLLFGLVIEPASDGAAFETDNLWKALHPASFFNIVGVVLLSGSILFLTGIVNWVLKVTFTMPPNSSWIPIAGWVAGLLGVLLTFS